MSLVLQAKKNVQNLSKSCYTSLIQVLVSLISKYMFKNLGKSCYRSLNIGTGMPGQILKTEVRLFKDSSISHSTSMFVANQMAVSESQICIIHFFSKATAA